MKGKDPGKDKPWVVQLTAEAIRKGAEMGSNLFHLQIVIEEAARNKPHAWISTKSIAKAMGRNLRTARRLLREWEGGDGRTAYGRRVVEGDGNDLVGIILFHRLDPKMPAATPETFDAAVEVLKADRRRDPSDKNVLAPGSESSYPSDKNVLAPGSESSYRISTDLELARNGESHTLAQSLAQSGESERTACMGGGENQDRQAAWREVWKGLAATEGQWWAWPEDRAAAYECALYVVRELKAEHMRPAADLVLKKPATLTAGGASWWSVAAAIVRASEQDPDRIRSLHKYINTLAREHHEAPQRPFDEYAKQIIAHARQRNDGMRGVERDYWRHEHLGPLLKRFVPAAGRAMAAIDAMEEDRFHRAVPGASVLRTTDQFRDRVRDLSKLLSDDDWLRLAEAAEAAVASKADDLPTLDDLLGRALGGGDGRVEADA